MEARKIQQMSEAYAQVYSEQETPMGQHPGKSTNKATRDRYETQRRRNEAPTGVGVPDKSVGYGGLKDDVNFDVIKDYLLDEGLASNEKAALAIMANMSEEWMQSILVEKPIVLLPGKRGYVSTGPLNPKDKKVSGIGPVGTYAAATPATGLSGKKTTTMKMGAK